MVGTEVVRPLFSGQIASLGSRLCAGSEYRFTIRRVSVYDTTKRSWRFPFADCSRDGIWRPLRSR